MESETPTKDTRLIREITLRNILSFGPDTPPFELRPLNVLIGPNGSGKSNLITALGFMRDTIKDKSTALQNAGGSHDLIWKGKPEDSASIKMDLVLGSWDKVTHLLQFSKPRHSSDLRIDDEQIIETISPNKTAGDIYYKRDLTKLKIKLSKSLAENELVTGEIDFSALEVPEIYVRRPQMLMLNMAYDLSRIFNNWNYTDLRAPQSADSRNDKLSEDMSNYQLYLGKIIIQPEIKRVIVDAMKDLYEGLTDITLLTQFGHVQLYVTEGNYSIPATRLSDGTLRYLCLLAILCDPEPPPLICIEEPELGLHMDVLPGLADLLVEASTRTQLIVTTHSEILVDALTDNPESVVVCEKHDGKTELQRLDAVQLAPYLKEYSLGNLWIDGDLGGKRW